MISLQDLKFQRNKLLTDMQAIGVAGFTTESRASFDKMNKRVEELEADIQRAELLEARALEQSQFTRSARPGQMNGGLAGGADMSDPEQRSKASKKAFLQFARGGVGALNSEQRDLISTSSNGESLIPQAFNAELIAALKYYGPIASLVRQRITDNNGSPIKVSLANDTANGLVLLGTEGTTVPPETDPAFQSAIMGVDTLSAGLIKVSFQELEDSYFDLDSWIREAFGIRYARGLERAVTLGVDGLGNALPNTVTGGLAGSAVVGDTTATVADGIGWNDLSTAYGALDPAYTTDKAVWQMNSNTRAYLVGLKDGFGRPFFQPDPSMDSPFARLMGYRVVINQSLPNMGANATPILFGDPSAAFLLRTDGQPKVLRLSERFADTLEVGFFLWLRAGAISIVASGAPNPLVSIKQAAE
jgi:HK97 family phage major capsid protein